MSTLITGASGMLGRDLQLAFEGRPVTPLGRARLDVTDAAAVLDAVEGHTLVVNTAAFTNVDDAETDEDTAYAVNALGAKHLAEAAARHGALFVQLSTDYVFDGTATEPYAENHPRHPISAYGRTKAAGEEFALAGNPGRTYIVRTAWLYGEHGSNFAATMLRLADQRETWRVVDDQVGQPTWTLDLATKIVELIDSGAPAGVYHGTSSGRTSWFGFARAVLEEAGLDPERIQPTTSAEFVRPAPRPAFSVLGHRAWAAAGLTPIRHWREALTASAIGAAPSAP